MVEDKAKELGRLIGQSPEYQALKRSSEALNEDKEAVVLLQDMEKLRGSAQDLIQRGENPTPEMEQQLDTMLEKNSVAARLPARRLRAGELRQAHDARESVDHGRHEEGRGEPDHHTFLSGRCQARS